MGRCLSETILVPLKKIWWARFQCFINLFQLSIFHILNISIFELPSVWFFLDSIHSPPHTHTHVYIKLSFKFFQVCCFSSYCESRKGCCIFKFGDIFKLSLKFQFSFVCFGWDMEKYLPTGWYWPSRMCSRISFSEKGGREFIGQAFSF